MHLPMRRGRTDSGSDSHEGERRTPEMSLERDVRLWAERPMPFGPVPGRLHSVELLHFHPAPPNECTHLP